MRKILTAISGACLTTLATLALAGPLSQQPPAPANPPDEGAAPNGRPGRGGNIENRLEMMSKQLNLTDEQRENIRPLLKHEVERIKEVRSNTELTQDQARRRIQMIRKNTRQKVAEILTPEQRKQWQEMRQEHRGGPDGGQKQPGGGDDPGRPAGPPNPSN